MSIRSVRVRILLGACLAACALPPGALGQDPDEHHEVPDDPPGIPAASTNLTSPAATVTFGRFTHIQANVNAFGANIVGDAANEPSIAVDPNDPSRIAIGWRQFDTITSNFREAGYAFSSDGGYSWITGEIESGIFRSDPVLEFNAQGKFFYNSLTTSPGFQTKIFPSTNGGATWGAGVPAFGGDKQWMAIDRTGGTGHNQIYEAWSTASNPTPGLTFSRSIDAGASYQSPTSIPQQPIWGTLAVGPDGTLYVAGISGTKTYVARSTNARNPGTTPTFTTVEVDLGGTTQTGGPNPGGLLGQVWIAVDRSSGPRSGWVYVLGSVARNPDPMDVKFIRSTDGGQTWSAPTRVNDDSPGNGAYQWFGTMSVSPGGRIDAVWNDTRGSADMNVSALYYSYSNDGGATWSANEQASPTWNSTVGWPNQSKIGDYYHMISRSNGADLAWAATFNGEQDVYYLRIPGGTTDAPSPRTPAIGLRSAPNPFRSFATITYEIEAPGAPARLEILDAAGRRIATLIDGVVAGGSRSVRWNGTDDAGRPVESGLYLARFTSREIARSTKLLLLR